MEWGDRQVVSPLSNPQGGISNQPYKLGGEAWQGFILKVLEQCLKNVSQQQRMGEGVCI